jgi:hypothetical protein
LSDGKRSEQSRQINESKTKFRIAAENDEVGQSAAFVVYLGSRLQKAASLDCANSCSRGIFTSKKIYILLDLDPLGPAVWQFDMGVDQKGGKPTSYL